MNKFVIKITPVLELQICATAIELSKSHAFPKNPTGHLTGMIQM